MQNCVQKMFLGPFIQETEPTQGPAILVKAPIKEIRSK